MDTGSAVEHLARAEAARVRPLRSEELDELDARSGLGRRLSAIRVARRAGGPRGARLVAEPVDRDPGHDNADRLQLLASFLNRRVLGAVDPAAFASDAPVNFRVELHDSYSYLPGRHLYEECLSFGRQAGAPERRVALIPDPYHMADFGGAVARSSADDVGWANKKPVLFFAGTTTGDREPRRNARLRACAWAAGRPDLARMHITNVAQMSVEDIVAAYPPGYLNAVGHAPIPIEGHFGYRYQANVVGNTACWSRLPMILASKSVAVHVRNPGADDAMWYYPLLREGRHYVGADSADGPDLERAVHFCRTYDRQCKAMTHEANALARDLFHSGSAASYLAAFLEEAALRGAP